MASVETSFDKFLSHIVDRKRSGLTTDYRTFNRIAHPGTYEAWLQPDNYDSKNRYINVICLDHTRVKLADADSDYVHANHIRIPDSSIEYIAAQGPLESTVIDFYRMLIQEQVAFIVMLTDMDHVSYKCHPYFPSEDGIVTPFGPFEVVRKITTIHSGYEMSILNILDARSGQKHQIHHCWFRDWPEFHVPKAEDFFSFMSAVNQCDSRLNFALKSSNIGPMLVHCAGGVGRTGCYIAIDVCCRQLLAEGVCPDVFKTVGILRDLRMHSVEREEQYLFVFLVVCYFGYISGLPHINLITFKDVTEALNIDVE